MDCTTCCGCELEDHDWSKGACKCYIERETGLKPCPFCGGQANSWDNGICEPVIDDNGAYVDILIDSPDMFGVSCTECCGQNIGYNTEAEAFIAWNTRAQ